MLNIFCQVLSSIEEEGGSGWIIPCDVGAKWAKSLSHISGVISLGGWNSHSEILCAKSVMWSQLGFKYSFRTYSIREIKWVVWCQLVNLIILTQHCWVNSWVTHHHSQGGDLIDGKTGKSVLPHFHNAVHCSGGASWYHHVMMFELQNVLNLNKYICVLKWPDPW